MRAPHAVGEDQLLGEEDWPAMPMLGVGDDLVGWVGEVGVCWWSASRSIVPLLGLEVVLVMVVLHCGWWR